MEEFATTAFEDLGQEGPHPGLSLLQIGLVRLEAQEPNIPIQAVMIWSTHTLRGPAGELWIPLRSSFLWPVEITTLPEVLSNSSEDRLSGRHIFVQPSKENKRRATYSHDLES